MFCPNCGNSLSETAKFCNKCGAPVCEPGQSQPQAATEQQAGSQPQPQVAYEQQEWQPQYQGTPMQTQPVKKRPIWPKIVIPVAIVAVVVVVAFAFGRDRIENFIKLHTMSPKDYYAYVEKKNITGATDAMLNSYERAYKLMEDKKYGYEEDVSVEVGEQVAQLVAMSGIDISKLKSLDFHSQSGVKDHEIMAVGQIGINGTDILTAELYFDTDNGEYYIRCPQINDGYIDCTSIMREAYGEASEEMGDYKELKGEKVFKAFTQNASDFLPKPEKVRGVVDELMDGAFDAVGDVKKSSEKLEVGSISSKYTVLELNLDGDDYQEAIENELDTAEDNKDIKEYLDRVEDLTGDEDLSSEYYDSIKDAREELKENPAVQDTDVKVNMKVYVDDVGEVRGREVTITNGEESVSYYNLMPMKGTKFEYECRLNYNGQDVFDITGKGKRSGGKLSGDFDVAVDPEMMPSEVSSYVYSMSSVLSIKVKDFDEKKLENGLVSGKFSVSTTVPLLSVYSLNFDVDQTEKGGSCKITCNQADEVLLAINSTLKESGAPKVDKPSSSDKVYDASNSEDMSSYIGDYDAIYSLLSTISEMTGIDIMSLLELGGMY